MRYSPSSTGSRCLVFLSLMVALMAVAQAETITENYPDGQKKIVYNVNASGEKHGSYDEYHPNGKRKIQANYKDGQLNGPYKSYFESGRIQIRGAYRNGEWNGQYTEYAEKGGITKQATYQDGKLHGNYQEIVEGQLVRDEVWLDGELLLPKSAKQIAAELALIQKAPVPVVGDLPAASEKYLQAAKDPALLTERQNATRLLMAYRYLCDLPYRDIALDRNYLTHDEAACDVLQQIGSLTHDPKNPGMPDADYQMAHLGCARSNLHQGQSSMLGAIKGFMDDSDPSNIDRLGHRRWCLNPALQKLGIARQGGFAAMWSMDSSRKEVPDYEFVAFPPRGLVPTEFFKADYAWHVSLNPEKYATRNLQAVSVQVWPVRFLAKQGTLQKAPQPLKLNFFNVDSNGFGISNCIIFRPDDVQVNPNAAYLVEITGVQNAKGENTPIQFLVAFLKL